MPLPLHTGFTHMTRACHHSLSSALLSSACAQVKIIPESILQMAIKVSNEPPSDMKSNMRRALAAFSADAEERLSSAAKRAAYRSILFGLCFYHSLLLGRKKFGTGIGTGARTASAVVTACLHTVCVRPECKCTRARALNRACLPACVSPRRAWLAAQARAAGWASAAATASTAAT